VRRRPYLRQQIEKNEQGWKKSIVRMRVGKSDKGYRHMLKTHAVKETAWRASFQWIEVINDTRSFEAGRARREGMVTYSDDQGRGGGVVAPALEKADVAEKDSSIRRTEWRAGKRKGIRLERQRPKECYVRCRLRYGRQKGVKKGRKSPNRTGGSGQPEHTSRIDPGSSKTACGQKNQWTAELHRIRQRKKGR